MVQRTTYTIQVKNEIMSIYQLLETLSRVFRNPHLIPMELNRLVYTRGWRWEYNHAGTNVLNEDWDTLLILDACRYDTFSELHSLPGTLEKATSVGGNTYEWLHGTFDGQDLRDTVYVTANPQLYRIRNDVYDVDSGIEVTFHDTVEVWQGGWDDEIRTVRPETVAEATRAALADYPEKRLIVHFIQPHFPFIGPTGREYFDTDHLNFNWEDHAHVPTEIMRRAYRENLDIVLPAVENLLADLDGKTVVTADHGEALGERDRPIPTRLFAHRRGHYANVLVDVPWLTYRNDDRRTITVEEPAEQAESVADDVVEQRLEDLGYT